MKTQIDAIVQKYGPESSPPPWQAFTIEHKPGPGNMHLVQKVFEGAFEVCDMLDRVSVIIEC
jgi:mannosyl-oligosaccharide glucosidase